MQYKDPLVDKYAYPKMVEIFSEGNRYYTWRYLWVVLAKCQQELGLKISDEQIQQMEDNVNNIDFELAQQLEQELKHDVMAHLHAFAIQAPLAKPIMHLGVTSEFIKDNTDLILIKHALQLIQDLLLPLLTVLTNFAKQYADLPIMGYTHYQVAQPTTLGKRACGWLQSLLNDYHEVTHMLKTLKFRSIKGTTGTLASFAKLFNHDFIKVKTLEQNITKACGFDATYTITGQTYDRKLDLTLLNALTQIAVSASKITNDIRLMQNHQEVQEYFEMQQVGSSAMPYKSNPIKCERIASLAKYQMSLPQTSMMIASSQWLERTLDDSAARRIIIPNSFFTTSAIIKLLTDVINNLVVNQKVIANNIKQQLPFLATENILMASVQQGADRQDIHEKIRLYAIKVKKNICEHSADNNLLDLIAKDDSFKLTLQQLNECINIEHFVGFAKEQVFEFIDNNLNCVIK